MKIFLSILHSIFFLVLLTSCGAIEKRKQGQAESGNSNGLGKTSSPAKTTQAKRAGEPKHSGADSKTPQGTGTNTDPAESAYQLGVKALQNKQDAQAFEHFSTAETLAASDGQAGRLWDARWGLLRTSIRLGRHEDTLRLAQKLQDKVWTPASTTEIILSELKAHEGLGDWVSLLATVDRSLKNSQIQDKEVFRSKASDVILGKLNEEALIDAQSKIQDENLRSVVFFRSGEVQLEKGDRRAARSLFSRAASLAPTSEIGQKASQIVLQLEALSQVNPKAIGAVLPLTGKFAQQGQRTLRGLSLGLGIHKGSGLTLQVIDSEGLPEKARRGVERLVLEDKVIAITGSLLSRTDSALVSKCKDLDVPLIALSQKSGLTEVDGPIFRNAVTSEMQVKALVKSGMEKWGLKKFALLYPNDAYGVEFANIFWDEVLARGGEIVAAQVYDPKETDFRAPVQRLVGTYHQDYRAEEYRLRLKWWKDQNKTSNQKPPEDLLPPVVNFDGIFIADGPKALGQIAGMLSYAGVKGVKLLGPQIWNTETLGKRAGSQWASSILFPDAYWSGSEEFKNSGFVKEYKALYLEDPGPFEIQAFEIGQILKHALASGARDREDLAKFLKDLKSTPGALGTLYQSPEREFLRPMQILGLRADSGAAGGSNASTPSGAWSLSPVDP